MLFWSDEAKVTSTNLSSFRSLSNTPEILFLWLFHFRQYWCLAIFNETSKIDNDDESWQSVFGANTRSKLRRCIIGNSPGDVLTERGGQFRSTVGQNVATILPLTLGFPSTLPTFISSKRANITHLYKKFFKFSFVFS